MYPYPNHIIQRIKNLELIGYDDVGKYKYISPCLLLRFNTKSKIRPIRVHRFKDYEALLNDLMKS